MRQSHRSALLTAIAFVASPLLVACSSESPTFTSASGPAYLGTNLGEVTCDAWLRGDDGFRSDVVERAADNRSTGHFLRITGPNVIVEWDFNEPSVTIRRPEGDVVGYEAFFDWACSNLDGDVVLASTFHEKCGLNFPTCADYLASDSEFRVEWASVFDYSGGVEDLTATCARFPDERFDDVVAFFDRYSQEAGEPRAAWETLSHLGYRLSNRIHVYPIQRGDVAHPDRVNPFGYCDDGSGRGPLDCDSVWIDVPVFTIGSTCGFNPDTDALVPLTLIVKNDTADDSVQLLSSFTISPYGTAETVSIDVAADFADGVECISGSDESPNTISVSTVWDFPADPGERASGAFFVVLHDYYSPSFPSGNSGDLEHYRISGVEYRHLYDPVVTLTNLVDVTLSGTVVN